MEVPEHLAYTAHEILQTELDVACQKQRPSFLLKPKLMIDGNQWCALLGDNLQDGVAGFGDSPDEAYADFDKSWYKKLKNSPGGRREAAKESNESN